MSGVSGISEGRKCLSRIMEGLRKKYRLLASKIKRDLFNAAHQDCAVRIGTQLPDIVTGCGTLYFINTV
jgi:hypothetical protein